MHSLVLIRNGESSWNKENRLTGWSDAELTPGGIREAHYAGQTLKENNFSFDVSFTSVLQRAIQTLSIILNEMELKNIPVYTDWRLNERHYGAVQGLLKEEAENIYGIETVEMWRKAYNVSPPLLPPDDPRCPVLDPKYSSIPPNLLPRGESLAELKNRIIILWNEQISPMIREGKKVLIAAHGNSIRSIIHHLENKNEDDFLKIKIPPPGVPTICYLDDKLKLIRRSYIISNGDLE